MQPQDPPPSLPPSSACSYHTSMLLLFWKQWMIWWLLHNVCYLFRHVWVLTSAAWQQTGLEDGESFPSAGAHVTWAPSCGLLGVLLLLLIDVTFFGFHRCRCGFVYRFKISACLSVNKYIFDSTESHMLFFHHLKKISIYLSLLPARDVNWRSPGNPCRSLYQRQDWRSCWPGPQI